MSNRRSTGTKRRNAGNRRRGNTSRKSGIRNNRNKRRVQERNRSIGIILLCVFCLLFALLLGVLLFRTAKSRETQKIAALQDTYTSEEWKGAPPIDVELLTENPYSRPGTPIDAINGVVIHYTANPGASAIDNRNYFENLKDTQDNKVSSHFVVGIEGEIVQCIPSGEVAYASNSRNSDTLSIECCHPDETGQFTDATYQSVVELTGWLCKRFNISVDNVIRHYDVTGKNCPKYFVENPEAWEQMKNDIQTQIDKLNTD